jgi:hypothetical protein
LRLRATAKFLATAKNACFQTGAAETSNANGCRFQLITRPPTPGFCTRDSGIRSCADVKAIHPGQTVLELGCGEGPLDPRNFWQSTIRGWHRYKRCSNCRAKSLNLPNADLKALILQASFEAYDVIAAIECVTIRPYRSRERFSRRLPKNTWQNTFVFGSNDYRHFVISD